MVHISWRKRTRMPQRTVSPFSGPLPSPEGKRVVSAVGAHPRALTGPTALTVLAVFAGVALAFSVADPADAREGKLRYGSKGPRVERLQRALRRTSYPAGPVDGVFGYKTLQAVYAFEKVHRLSRNGTVSRWQLKRILSSHRPWVADRRVNDFVEIDISRQVMFKVKDGHVRRTIPVSTGSEKYYTVDGRTYKAHTPRGHFRIQRKIRGWRYSRLGGLYYPSYFYRGYAIHGSRSVPTHPASHGCVRIPMHLAKPFFWHNPIGRHVFIHN
jgi:hypothetical protein